jgi:uncharacterized protein YdeI (YjbR/CyaY-like superfamily)
MNIVLCFGEIIDLTKFLNIIISYDEEFILQAVSMEEKKRMTYRIQDEVTETDDS